VAGGAAEHGQSVSPEPAGQRLPDESAGVSAVCEGDSKMQSLTPSDPPRAGSDDQDGNAAMKAKTTVTNRWLSEALHMGSLHEVSRQVAALRRQTTIYKT
jgi:hypothetical protein